MGKEKYPSINGLRAFSILVVIFHHLSIQNNLFKDIIKIKWLLPLTDFLTDGQMGVNVFFVISGFLITSLMLKEEKATNTISLKKFYIRRILRIFPAYYFLLIVYAILQIFQLIYINKASWITSITYTTYLKSSSDWFTAHFWSLSVEEHFYVLWPICFIAGNQFRKAVIFIFLVSVPALREFTHFHPIAWINELTLFTRIDSIATGCFFAIYKDDIIKITTPYWKTIFYISAILFFSLRYIIIFFSNIKLGFLLTPFGYTHGTIANFLIAIIMMYAVFGPKGIFFKILNLRFINHIGILSYSIYLWQQLFIYKSQYWINGFPQNIILISIIAEISYHFIEMPFLRLKSKFVDSDKNKLHNNVLPDQSGVTAE